MHCATAIFKPRALAVSFPESVGHVLHLCKANTKIKDLTPKTHQHGCDKVVIDSRER